MIFDAVPFRENLSESDVKAKALGAFTGYLEKKLGAKIVRDLHDVPYNRPDLQKPFEIAALLKEHGVIKTFGKSRHFSDEPRLNEWYTVCNDPLSHPTGGTSWDNDADAFYAALAEGLERYIWLTQNDYFVNPTRATTAGIAKRGPFIAPEEIVGFSSEQRALDPRRQLRPDTEYLWIQGTSLLNGKKTYMPAQVVTGIRRHEWSIGVEEPLIRQQITNGLATWPTQSGAWLAGALEVIEREAYMIMWLNQLTLPRIALTPLLSRSPSLAKAMATCAKYQFKTHVIQLITDAPTHAVAVVMEDTSGSFPRFCIGIRTHRSLPTAIEKAMMEALRSYRGYRIWANEGNTWDNSTPIEKIGHRDRLYYWGFPENTKHLEFMIQGKEIEVDPKEWDNDTIEENLQRIIRWCKEKDFDCVSFPLTRSAKNPTTLHIEMVVMPQLQPTYLHEPAQQFGGIRWKEIPKTFGYTPREKPFAERPHPFS